MAKRASITRRDALSAAAAYSLPAASLAPLAIATPGEAEILEWGRLSEESLQRFLTRPEEWGDEDPHGWHDDYLDLEAAVIRAPTVSRRVAALQLKLGLKTDGELKPRSDGLGELALEKVIAYLEGR